MIIFGILDLSFCIWILLGIFPSVSSHCGSSELQSLSLQPCLVMLDFFPVCHSELGCAFRESSGKYVVHLLCFSSFIHLQLPSERKLNSVLNEYRIPPFPIIVIIKSLSDNRNVSTILDLFLWSVFFSFLVFGHLVFFPSMPGNLGCWTLNMKNCRVSGWSYLTRGRINFLPRTFKVQACYFNNQWVRYSKAIFQIVRLSLKLY